MDQLEPVGIYIMRAHAPGAKHRASEFNICAAVCKSCFIPVYSCHSPDPSFWNDNIYILTL